MGPVRGRCHGPGGGTLPRLGDPPAGSDAAGEHAQLAGV